MIPVIDVFAGPGGLGEGFSSWRLRNRQCFQLAASFEKDPVAHATLRFRAFCRAFEGSLPRQCELFTQSKISWAELEQAFPHESAIAKNEARCITLGRETAKEVRGIIAASLPEDGPWILVGGPPCQAYSLAGRSRNKGIATYKPELDSRQTLYVEYLQILADHEPPVFVMENVKGLLSAKVNSLGMFDRIREDLSDPVKALKREGRSTRRGRPRYALRALHAPSGRSSDGLVDDPRDFLVKAEMFGIPQRRHRVILVGVREDIDEKLRPFSPSKALTVEEALQGFPRVRSGLSKEPDSDQAWRQHLREMPHQPWMREVSAAVRKAARAAAAQASAADMSRGAEYLRWHGKVLLNNTSRTHIVPDLERYLFASAFAKVNGRSPRLSELPSSLLPQHENVQKALKSGDFADRFRVQVGTSPSSTVTSHISKDGHYYIHPDPSQCRSLTVREAAELQTFPRDYFFCGRRTGQYHQVGNAVPPKLASQIAAAVGPLLGL